MLAKRNSGSNAKWVSHKTYWKLNEVHQQQGFNYCWWALSLGEEKKGKKERGSVETSTPTVRRTKPFVFTCKTVQFIQFTLRIEYASLGTCQVSVSLCFIKFAQKISRPVREIHWKTTPQAGKSLKFRSRNLCRKKKEKKKKIRKRWLNKWKPYKTYEVLKCVLTSDRKRTVANERSRTSQTEHVKRSLRKVVSLYLIYLNLDFNLANLYGPQMSLERWALS